MANRLVPYSQDEQKWASHYMTQAMKQIKPKEMTKPLKEKMVQPSIVLPTMQLVAQAESELKRQKNEAPVFEPIKATPQFETSNISQSTIKQSTRKRKAPSKRKKSHKKAKSSTQFRDIFN